MIGNGANNEWWWYLADNPVFKNEVEWIETLNCKACDNDMTAEIHEDKHQICEYCRDYAREHDGQTVEELMDDLNIER
jgi:hypothetical protein